MDFFKWLFWGFGLDKSLSTTERLNVGIWKRIYTSRPLDRMFSHMFCWLRSARQFRKQFLQKTLIVVYFSTSPNLFHANGRIYEANIFFYETLFPQELKN